MAKRWSDRGTRQQRGYGRRWEQLREAVLRRDNGLCQPCARGNPSRLTVGREVDHITPKARGGTDDLENLQTICADCHRAKSAREGVEGRGQTTHKPAVRGCDENGLPLDPSHHWRK